MAKPRSGLLDRSGKTAQTSDPAKFKAAAPPEREVLTERTEEHSYIYAGGKLLRETVFIVDEQGSEIERTLDFRYDNVGFPYALHYTDTFEGIEQTYYYVTNLQGDVMYMVDETGDEVASYEYDPYGKLLRTTGDFAETNPIRYRGYYCDNETDFYYLQFRYYDATTCRFISADSFTNTCQSILGYNMFAYCKNDPINRFDPTGHIPNKMTMMTDGGGNYRYIDDQGTAIIGDYSFNCSTIAASGCGIIATYNALETLGDTKSIQQITDYYSDFENNFYSSVTLGYIGILPSTVEQYFLDAGYTVIRTDDRDAIDYYSSVGDVSILWYVFNTDAFPGIGAHFVAYEPTGEGIYQGHNTSGDGRDTFKYPSDYIYSYSIDNRRFYAVGIFIFK